MIEFTLWNATGVFGLLVGTAFLVNGLRYTWLDDILLGAAIVIASWYVLAVL